jgi:hypothetical protein
VYDAIWAVLQSEPIQPFLLPFAFHSSIHGIGLSLLLYIAGGERGFLPSLVPLGCFYAFALTRSASTSNCSP